MVWQFICGAVTCTSLTKTTYMLHICDVYVAVTYICQITVHICDIYVEVLKCLYIYVTYM